MFVAAHPSHKNRDVARVGHPILCARVGKPGSRLDKIPFPGLKSETWGTPS
jgi:hypothetical protein